MPLDEVTRAARSFLKDTIRRRVNFARTDQSRGVPPPPAQMPCPAGVAMMAGMALRLCAAEGKGGTDAAR